MDDQKAYIRYNRILASLEDVAECTKGKLILIGGTALAIFYLNHRASVDLDFVPLTGDDVKLKEELKGELSKKGFTTLRSRYVNQFVLQFSDTSVKVEIFIPDEKVKVPVLRNIGNSKILVASLEDLFDMKLLAYSQRKASRDLFDIFMILKKKNQSLDLVKDLILKCGKPERMDELRGMVADFATYDEFEKVVSNVIA